MACRLHNWGCFQIVAAAQQIVVAELLILAFIESWLGINHSGDWLYPR
jgi:hypothetical protein